MSKSFRYSPWEMNDWIVPVVTIDALEWLQSGVNVEMFVESEDGGEALLADCADKRLGTVSQPTMFHHLKINWKTVLAKQKRNVQGVT